MTGEKPLKLNFLIIAALTATSMWAADAAAGKAVYAAKCKSCHGADGEGNPTMAKALKVEIKPLSATTTDVKDVIVKGQGKMKPMPAITGADLDNVVAYVNGMKK
jgi:mono/diheme cytochrome c family protein